jgi:probable phosphoglycerate mutase
MRLLIIRHGDPDYEHDSLTEKGKKEAKLLADYLEKEKIDYFYVSSYGRAKETAAPTLERHHATPVICEYLHEFDYPTYNADGTRRPVAWDLMPAEWTVDDRNYSLTDWSDTSVMKSGDLGEKAADVIRQFDECLARHGYTREGQYYKTVQGNDLTIAFFCHLGVECVLLSHLLGISPVLLWQGTMAQTTSVTTLYTEERQKGIAYFRMTCFGDTSHLRYAGEPTSFAGRFCEVYENFDERH